MNLNRINRIRELLAQAPQTSMGLFMEGIDADGLLPGECAMMQEFSRRQRPNVRLITSALSDAEFARLLAVLFKHEPIEIHLEALSGEERQWWDDLWRVKPDVSEWTDSEACVFDQLFHAARTYAVPYPQNGRCAGIGYVTMMANCRLSRDQHVEKASS